MRNDVLAYVGLTLLLAALVVRLAVLDSGPVPVVLAVAGLMALLVFLFREGRGIQGFLGRRSTREGGGVLTTALFVLGSVVLLNVLAARFRVREDLTADRLYTLSPETEAVLRSLPEPPQVWVFVPEGSPEWMRMEVLLESVRRVVPELTSHFVDPEKEPLTAMEFGILNYSTVVQVGERRESFLGATEQALLEALVRASHPKRARIAFVAGHGEPYLGESGPTGLRSAAEVLDSRGYEIMSLDLPRTEAIPESLEVLVIPGPRSEPSPAEELAVERFLARGGRLFLLLEPGRPVPFAGILEQYGLTFLPDFLSDPQSRDPQILVTPFVSAHPAVEVARATRMPGVFPGAGRIEVERGRPGVAVDILVRSNRDVRVEGEDGSEGEARNLVVAAVKDEGSGVQSRLVVAADADFASNRLFGTQGNAYLFLGLVRWLGQEEVDVTLSPRPATSRPVVLSQQQGRAFMVLLVGLLPLAVLGMGTVTWWRRR